MRAALPGYEKIKLRKAAAPYQVRLDSGAPQLGGERERAMWARTAMWSLSMAQAPRCGSRYPRCMQARFARILRTRDARAPFHCEQVRRSSAPMLR